MSITFEELSSLLIDSMASVCGSVPAVYVAGPLTSCREYYFELMRDRHADASRYETENRAAMAGFADDLRAKVDAPVLDPGLLHVERWTGQEHGTFFIRALERFCTEVRFMDGWAYSRGATKEFVHAQQLGLTCTDRNGDHLSRGHGVRLIEETVAELERGGLDASRFRQRLDLLAAGTAR